MSLRIGIVAEGSHDYFMLEPLLSNELIKRGRAGITFDRLQPTQDATGTFPGGGWSRVVAWCLAHAGDDLSDVFQPPIRNIPALDGLLIHMDGDAAALIEKHTLVKVPSRWTPTTRISYLTDAVEEWLDVDSHLRQKIIMAFPVMHTEAWMNASRQQSSGPFEISNAKNVFRARRNGAGASLADYYSLSGVFAGRSTALISKRCVSYRKFEKEIASSTI